MVNQYTKRGHASPQTDHASLSMPGRKIDLERGGLRGEVKHMSQSQ